MSANKLYRSRNGMILGVCRGLAEYLGVSVKWTRILTVLTMIFTGFFPVAFFYVLAAFLMKLEPNVLLSDGCEDLPYGPMEDLVRLRRKFDRLANRVHNTTEEILKRDKNHRRRMSA